MGRSIKIFSLIIISIFSTSVFSSENSSEPYPNILDASAINPAVNPCDDFYLYACGAWLDRTVIPADKRGVSRQVTPMADGVDEKLNQILVKYSNGDFTPTSTYAKKLGDFYSSCMNSNLSNTQALQKIKAQIYKIKQTKTEGELAVTLAKLKLLGVNAFFNFYSMQDYNDSSKVIGSLGQGGMTLDNPEYYTEKDERSEEIRSKYLNYIQRIFTLIGEKPNSAKKIAQAILTIESKLASKALNFTDQSDPEKVNHPMTLDEIKSKYGSNFWQSYFSYLKFQQENLNVDEPEYFENLKDILIQTNKIDRDNYLSWLVLNHYANELGSSFQKAHFEFWEAFMNGRKSRAVKWKECTRITEYVLGDALAEAYIKTFDGNAIKIKTDSMIENIKNTFIEDLHLLSKGVEAWIDGATLEEAITKTLAIDSKVGAPEKFRNYESLKIERDSFLLNMQNIANFETVRDLKKIGHPVDKSEWGMMPWEINAYYDRSNNEFAFPFGILMPPSLDLTASDGANYGAFGGGTIGHELTHGFDNNGSKYDSHGNLKNWWSQETSQKFKEKAQCFIDQANAYNIKEVNLNVDGNQTLEENLSDQGGVKLGYMALDKILQQRQEAPAWNGMNERQQYWIAYAQSWCTKATQASLSWQVKNDEHPPAEFRVNAVMMNRPEFAKDFNCHTGNRMVPSNRCSLW